MKTAKGAVKLSGTVAVMEITKRRNDISQPYRRLRRTPAAGASIAANIKK